MSVCHDNTVTILLIYRNSVLISDKRQRRLSGYGYIDIGLPPASPAGSNDTVSPMTCLPLDVVSIGM